jgi:hypothetical protein
MPNTIVVHIPPYEGEYPIDINTRTFSTFEWRTIKKISGYMPLTITEGWEGGDPDLFLALAIIAMLRAGRIEKREMVAVAESLEDAEVDGVAISFVLEDDEAEADDADPPNASSEPESSSSTEGSKPGSGEDSSGSSGLSPERSSQSTSGSPDSVTGSDSDRLTLAK